MEGNDRSQQCPVVGANYDGVIVSPKGLALVRIGTPPLHPGLNKDSIRSGLAPYSNGAREVVGK